MEAGVKRSFIHDFDHYLFTVEHLQNNTIMEMSAPNQDHIKNGSRNGLNWPATQPRVTPNGED